MIKRRRNRTVEMNVSSFADIAFLLIIFFVLTTTFVKDTGTKLDIPSAAEDSKQESKSPTVNLTGDEILITEGTGSPTAYTMSGFMEWLKVKKFENAEGDAKFVILEAAEDVSYQRYFTVFHNITQSGGLVVLMTQEKGSDKD